LWEEAVLSVAAEAVEEEAEEEEEGEELTEQLPPRAPRVRRAASLCGDKKRKRQQQQRTTEEAQDAAEIQLHHQERLMAFRLQLSHAGDLQDTMDESAADVSAPLKLSNNELDEATKAVLVPVDANETCLICRDGMKGSACELLACEHRFHWTCITRWLKECNRICPHCRADAMEFTAEVVQTQAQGGAQAAAPTDGAGGAAPKAASAVASGKEVAPKNNSARGASAGVKAQLLVAWDRINSHKYATHFRKPVKESDAPNYYAMINKPMDLGKIKQLIERGQLTTFVHLRKAMDQIAANASNYNGASSEYALAAAELKQHSTAVLRQISSPPRKRAKTTRSGKPFHSQQREEGGS
jgi:hypothetical protein